MAKPASDEQVGLWRRSFEGLDPHWAIATLIARIDALRAENAELRARAEKAEASVCGAVQAIEDLTAETRKGIEARNQRIADLEAQLAATNEREEKAEAMRATRREEWADLHAQVERLTKQHEGCDALVAELDRTKAVLAKERDQVDRLTRERDTVVVQLAEMLSHYCPKLGAPTERGYILGAGGDRYNRDALDALVYHEYAEENAYGYLLRWDKINNASNQPKEERDAD